MDERVSSVIEAQRTTFQSLGCQVEDTLPDFRDADEVFKIWRAWRFAIKFEQLIKTHRDQIKDTVIWNTEEGLKLSGLDLSRAEVKRTSLYQRVREFMKDYEYLVLPVNQVPPFDVNQHYIEEINGVAMETYIDWMKSCYYVTVTGLPAISVPCGFTPEGLPVGVQIVGRHQQDLGVLQLAYAFQQATRFADQKPPLLAQ